MSEPSPPSSDRPPTPLPTTPFVDPDATTDDPAPAGTRTLPDGGPHARAGAAGRRSVAGYEVLGELGRGGMGVVYRAHDPRLNRDVALKMVLAGAHAAPAELARFLHEAEAVAALKHPNVVQVHEVGTHDGLPFFT